MVEEVGGTIEATLAMWECLLPLRRQPPTKVDSKLSDAHLESLKRREGEEEMPLRPRVELSAVRFAQKILLSEYRTN
jgi:hypothetical protein